MESVPCVSSEEPTVGATVWDFMSGVTDTRPSCSQDMDALGVRRPSAVVRVTEHMDVIRAYISGILEKGMAYQARDGVYFDVARFTQRWCTSRGQS